MCIGDNKRSLLDYFGGEMEAVMNSVMASILAESDLTE